jgi:hypothetical protein
MDNSRKKNWEELGFDIDMLAEHCVDFRESEWSLLDMVRPPFALDCEDNYFDNDSWVIPDMPLSTWWLNYRDGNGASFLQYSVKVLLRGEYHADGDSVTVETVIESLFEVTDLDFARDDPYLTRDIAKQKLVEKKYDGGKLGTDDVNTSAYQDNLVVSERSDYSLKEMVKDYLAIIDKYHENPSLIKETYLENFGDPLA